MTFSVHAYNICNTNMCLDVCMNVTMSMYMNIGSDNNFDVSVDMYRTLNPDIYMNVFIYISMPADILIFILAVIIHMQINHINHNHVHTNSGLLCHFGIHVYIYIYVYHPDMKVNVKSVST